MFNVTQKFVYFNIKILKHYWKLMVDTVLLKSGNNFAFSFFLQRMTITLHNIACKDGLVKLLCCVIDLFNPFQSSVTFLYPCDTGLKWVKYFCRKYFTRLLSPLFENVEYESNLPRHMLHFLNCLPWAFLECFRFFGMFLLELGVKQTRAII